MGQSILGVIDHPIFSIPVELLVGQLATHFAAILFGVFAASILYSRPWPSAALTLDRPSVVYAIPLDRVRFNRIQAGDSVNIVIDKGGVCTLNTKPLRLLAAQPVVLLSVSIDDFRGLAVADWLKGGMSRITLATGKFKRCADQSNGLIVERSDGEAKR